MTDQNNKIFLELEDLITRKGDVARFIARIEETGFDLNQPYVPDAYNNKTTLLHCAARAESKQCLEATEYLLKHGADPNGEAVNGNIALHSLILGCDFDAIELTMRYPVDLSIRHFRTGLPCLMLFVKFCYGKVAWKSIVLKKRCLSIVEAMLRQGAAYSKTEWLPEYDSLARLYEKYPLSN